MRARTLLQLAFLTAMVIACFIPRTARAAEDYAPRPLQSIVDKLPDPVSKDLEVVGWLWLSDLQTDRRNHRDLELSLTVSKTFNQRVSISAEGNFIDADGSARPELEQGFVSMLLSERSGTILTLGKFNSNFGVEPHDFWNRKTGTTSLLYNAQPQDIVGAMLTQPVGDTGITLRPFISGDFQGGFDFHQNPSGGLMVEYGPTQEFNFAVTNWVGPGVVLVGGDPLRPPFPQGAYGTDGQSVVENWQGPNLVAQRDSTLYFMAAKAVWRPRPDFMLAGEYLLGTTGTSIGRWGWHGWMVLTDYTVTDRLHVFGQYSWLDDSDWLITGFFQKCQQVSCGFGYEIMRDMEVRCEYRHDFSNVTPDFDSVSVHLTMAF